MFPTLFYIFVLFYEGLFSVSSEKYNAQINQVNQQIIAKNYSQALKSAQLIKQSSIFINPDIERLIAILDLKNRKATKKRLNIMLNSTSLEGDILSSHFLAKEGDLRGGILDLKNSIIKNGNIDTLVKSYELYAFYFPQNKLKNQAKSTQMISQTQKINTQEALSLLDLMKKKQKNLIF
jgi:hypothetical protein